MTALAAAFFLGPELLSRWLLAFVVPRRTLSQNRGEETIRAILWTILPLWLAAWWFAHDHVLPQWGSWHDVEVVASSLYSTASFERQEQMFYPSLVRVAGMASSLLWRLYLLVALAALLLNAVTLRYRWLRAKIRFNWARKLLATAVLPRISEWHLVLSDILLPLEDDFVIVDVLTRNGTLYRGRVRDRSLGQDGSLLTLTLADPARFLRDEFASRKNADHDTNKEDFWHPIPSKLFILLGSDIINVNVRYMPKPALKQKLPQQGLTEAELETLRTLISKAREPEPLQTPVTVPERPTG